MHTCPDCYQPCHCNNDLDDIQFDDPPNGATCQCDCQDDDFDGYCDIEDEDEECDYCGRSLPWAGSRTPSGAVACDDCEVEVWGTEGGRPADRKCQGCERATARLFDGYCHQCDNDNWHWQQLKKD